MPSTSAASSRGFFSRELVTVAGGIGIAIWLWGTGLDRGHHFRRQSRRDDPLRHPPHRRARPDPRHRRRSTDLLVRFNGPLVLLRLDHLARRPRGSAATPGSSPPCWGFFAVLLTYKVGNQQFWLSWLVLVAALPLVGAPDPDRLARTSWPFAIFLTLFQLGYVLLQPSYYQGSLTWVNDVVGVPAFVLGAWLLWSYLGPGVSREPRPRP
ncbi:MAG: hypothetical protein QM687_09250 [Ferruginibacter sp.]